MCYMLSRQGYLDDRAGPWNPTSRLLFRNRRLQLGAQTCQARRFWHLTSLRPVDDIHDSGRQVVGWYGDDEVLRKLVSRSRSGEGAGGVDVTRRRLNMHTTILATLLRSLARRFRCAAPASYFSWLRFGLRRLDIARGRGLDKIVALSNSCFAIPLASFQRRASLGRKIHHASRALVHAMAFVLGVLRGHCVARRVLEHCHKNSGALVRPAVRDHDVSLCGDDTYPASWSPAPETESHG